MKRFFAVLMALASPAPALAAAAAFDARIDAIVVQQQQDQHIPGLALLVVKDDKIVYAKAFGLRDIDRKLPVTLDTLFPIGSCTKAFTSMAVALSADAGLMSFVDHPRKFLPWFKMADPEADVNVTLTDMLSHRTGLMAYADLAAAGDLGMEDYARAATSAEPTAKFHSKFQYSNAMVVAAGLAVGAANHSDWATVVDRRIFVPLGMTASNASVLTAMQAPDHATGYVYDDAAKLWRATPPPAELMKLAPAGSIASSANDMAKWLRMLSGGGMFGGKRFVSQAGFDELTTAKIPVNAQMSYAMGWAVYDWNGQKVVEHNGGSEGISALVSFIPSRHVGFVFLANTSPNFMTKVGNAAKLLYPIVLNEPPPQQPGAAPAPAAQAAPPAVPDATLPSTDALIARMIAVAGGAKVLRRHRSLTIHAVKSYENQGVTADVTILAKAPAMSDAVEEWHAAGKQIARVRVYFDGTKGGQETTFGQDDLFDADTNAQALRDDALHPLLDLQGLYKAVLVTGRAKIGEEDAYVLELTPEKGKRVDLTISAKTGLVLRRESAGVSELYSDYRQVDGERIAFRTDTEETLGETVQTINNASFGAAIPQGSFMPAHKPAR